MNRKTVCICSITILCLCLLVFQSFAATDITNPDDLVTRHIKSIGSPGILSEVQSRGFVGQGTAKYVQGGTGVSVGTGFFVSQGKKESLRLVFNSADYPGEYIAYDGKDVTVKNPQPGQKSPLPEFLLRFKGIIKQGFLGGTLSTSWPLLNITKDAKPDMKLRKATVEKHELYELEYQPKEKIAYVKIKMYFDPETFHHVRTDYLVRTQNDASTQDPTLRVDTTAAEPTSGQVGTFSGPRSNVKSADIMGTIPDSIYHLVEKFDDFKPESGLTLPHKYTLEYTVEGSGNTIITDWELIAEKWTPLNMPYKDELFKAEK
jgi:hypothetical protein